MIGILKIMAKSKDKNELEHFRGEIRALQKENRALKKQLRQYEKYSQENTDDDIPELPKSKNRYCFDCGKGIIKEFEVLGRYFEECNLCDYRKKIK